MVRMRRRVSDGGVVELRGWPGLAMIVGAPDGVTATGGGITGVMTGVEAGGRPLVVGRGGTKPRGEVGLGV